MFTVPSANLTTSYCDGLGYALSGIAAYINSFILSATMVRRISDISVIGSRFRFSYQFTTMLVKQVEDWMTKFKVENVGGQIHNELWVPAEELEEFNSNIVGQIEVTKEFRK